MGHLENTERHRITTSPEHANHIRFEGYAAHHNERGGREHVHHGKELHLGNAYDHAKPDPKSHCFGPCEKAKHWHPNPEDQSPKAKEWRKNFEKQDHEKLSTDQEHKYDVKPGDAMDSIARRALNAQGMHKPTHEQLQRMEQGIIGASKKDNPTL